MMKCIILIAAMLFITAMAQRDPDTVYNDDGDAIAFRYNFRVPLALPADSSEDAVLPTTLPSSCSFAKAYIAKSTAWIEYHSSITSPTSTRATYLFTAKQIQASQKSCFDELNSDPLLWKQNYNSACKYRSTCGGSTVCSCPEGASCARDYDADGNLISSDFCDIGYLCTSGVCTYSRVPLTLKSYNETWSEQKFYDLARDATCSFYQLTPTYNLAQSKNLYFSAISDVPVSEECINVLAKGFGGNVELEFADESCKSQCGALSCVCEKGNLCSLSWDEKAEGHKQCADKLKCELNTDGTSTCNNGVVATIFVAIACVAMAMLF